MMRKKKDKLLKKKKMLEKFVLEEIEKYIRINKRNEKELRYIA